MIFIWYKNNSYYFIYHTQKNIIFYSINAIFDKEIFPKYTNSYAKECKLYNKLLNKISPETESSAPDLLQSQNLRVDQEKELCIRVTQENSI